MPKVSVIVPVYNVEKYLQRCLDSLLKQTLEDIEIICINDGSTDNSLDIIETNAKRDSRIKVFSQVNLGLSAARNLGLEHVTGEYVGFVDSDDFVDDDYFEKLYEAAIKYNAEIACGNIVRENEKKKKFIVQYSDMVVADDVKAKYQLAQLPKHCYVWNKIYKRDALIKSGVKFVPGVAYEDMIFSPDIIEKLGRMVSVPDTFHHYWINKKSIISTPTDKNRSDAINANQYLMQKCRQYNICNKNTTLISREEYFFLGLKILKIYKYQATKKYLLFGLLPILEMRAK